MSDTGARRPEHSESDEVVQVLATIARNEHESVVVALTQYRIDVRTFITPKEGGKKIPTRKGVRLPTQKLPELIAALQSAYAIAKKRGARLPQQEAIEL